MNFTQSQNYEILENIIYNGSEIEENLRGIDKKGTPFDLFF